MESFFLKGLAQSMYRAYSSGQKRYLTFCSQQDISPFPATEERLSFLGESGHKTQNY